MLDFFQVSTKDARGGKIEIRPDFVVGRSKDLMVRGQSFYAIWDEEQNLWSTDEYDVRRLVDEELQKYVEKATADGALCDPKYLRSYSTNGWNQFKKFMKNVADNSHQLDMNLTFANTDVKKSHYSSRKLPYSLAPGKHDAWDEMVSFLYSPEEKAKIEWAIGAVFAGDSKKLEKFLVFYGPGGTGKSTILKIIEKLFEGYVAMFEAKSLVGNNNSFSTEAFKHNPLVAIQHDGDLSKIEDNSKLNSIVGHDKMLINEKYKPGYEMKIQAFLFMGTNKPVKITDSKSGLIRRLIDVKPTGNTFEPDHYYSLMQKIDFELGAIAQHCLDTYRRMGKNYYNGYQPTDMMLQTDVFYNYIEAHYDIFKHQGGTTLKQAWELYKAYAEDAELGFKMPMHKFREQLKDYFETFYDRTVIDGTQTRSYYETISVKQFKSPVTPETKPPSFSLVMDETMSVLDEMLMDQPAQYANNAGTPETAWAVAKGVLSEIDTTKLHFVKVPDNHIVIDFDLKDGNGEKSLEENLRAASNWPPTYAEVSKSGGGVHLHYEYTGGDARELAAGYSDGIEIKVYTGNSSLRRQLTKCNNVPVAAISSGLPFKEKKPVLEKNVLQSEKGLRDLIDRNLKKEVHVGTKPSIDFIKKILDDAYQSGMAYDVSDLRPRIMSFAMGSTNQSLQCLKVMKQMKFAADDTVKERAAETAGRNVEVKDDRVVFYDVEVYPNLFVVCWKYEGAPNVVRMINPSPADVEALFSFKLVGFNNRKYDNHILWARMMGASIEELYVLSQKIINNDHSAMFGEAYGLSYADIYDFSSIKQGLKKFQIQLGLPHVEMDIPWDQPVPEHLIEKVVDYCCNDVNSTEAVFKDRKQDFIARQILADLSGLDVNSTTRKHAEKIIFGKDRTPQGRFVYTDLAEVFPGYQFNPFAVDKSTYKGEVVGEGGYVYAEPGIYEDVALLDIASMHPTSIEELELFGPYTKKYSALKSARLALKHDDVSEFEKLMPGVEYPSTEQDLKGLSDALKLVLNSVYGYTSATFDNPFRDKRNVDNIVAKRGALFMIDLKHAVQEQGFTVAHIKTDSIKIPNATPEIIDFVFDYGKKYGYVFEHEGTYKKMCLVNDAVYIAKTNVWVHDSNNKWVDEGKWTATGAQFQHPYVFKTLFSKEPLTFRDLCETKQVSKGVMYLQFEHKHDQYEQLHHVGKTGLFIPVTPEVGGGKLLRINEDKEYAIGGTKGYLWIEAEMVKVLNGDALERMPFEDINEALEGTGSIADIVDMAYFQQLAEDAAQAIEKYGSYEEFVK